MSEIYHAWFSQKAANLYGSIIYAREDGTEVEVTVAKRKIEHGETYLWDDKKYVGEVVRYVRRRQPNKLTVIKKLFIPNR